MKKILLGAAVSAALFGGVAQAAITFNANNMPDAVTLNDTTIVYLSGSSALSDLIERGLTVGSNEGVCKAGTIHKFVDLGTGGNNQQAYICALNTAANGSLTPNTAIPAGITKSNLLVYKRNEGGSGKGVVPIVKPAQIAFLNVTTNPTPCTTATSTTFASVKTCDYNSSTNATFATPTFGLSDVNPQIFSVGTENAPVGTTPPLPPGPTSSTYQIIPAPGAVFGIIATTKLRNALQQAQFPAASTCNPTNAGYKDVAGTGVDTADSLACMPNLNSDQIADLFAGYPTPVSPLKANISAPAAGAGKIHQWTQLKTSAFTNLFDQTVVKNKPANAKVHICSRTVGSGTKAQFGVKFLNNGCSSGSSKMVQHFDHSAYAEPGQANYKAFNPINTTVESALRPVVHAMASGGGLAECMDELDSGAANSAGSFAPASAYGAPGATAVRWAIGIQSLDKNADLSKNYRFIKVDGVAPILKTVVNGKYPDWVEATFQYNVNTLPSGALRNLVLEIVSSFTTPSVISFVNTKTGTHTFGTSGVIAVPNSIHPALVNGTVDLAKPVNPLSHAVFPGTGAQATNNCRNPLIYSNNPNNNNQGLQLN
ncbi:MAG: hypothetical protein WAW36_10445 [Methylovulum miyakonense]|uniref:hypothetical protein n=1 Tax=Methylovulum miyakonense TaxID=645578 RepID=UPI003BB4AF4D